MKVYIFVLLLLFSNLFVYSQHKVDSSLRYRWPNSSRDTSDWDLTYGWYDTVKVSELEEGGLWIFDTVKKNVLFEPNGWYIMLRFPPPPYCRCIGKYIRKEYLDENKKKFSSSAIVMTQYDVIHQKD